MKKVTAVIAEYNPFHLGHARQNDEMRKRGITVAVMSGSFTQRGEAAILSKYKRAEVAVQCGVDLVLELPFPFSASPAMQFGEMGVAVLNALFPTAELCFGSESDDIAFLQTVVSRMESGTFAEALADTLEKSHAISYRSAVTETYRKQYGKDAFPKGSNDLLALSYLHAMKNINSQMTAHPVLREGQHFNGEGDGLLSASSIRQMLASGNVESCKDAVPPACFTALKEETENGRTADANKLFPLFASLVRGRGESVFENIYDIPTELASRMLKAAFSCTNDAAFLDSVKTRQYSVSRVRRAVLYTLLGVTKESFAVPPFTSVLAANKDGRELLAHLRKSNTALPILTKPADFATYGEPYQKAYHLVYRADSLWELLTENPLSGDDVIRQSPYIQK